MQNKAWSDDYKLFSIAEQTSHREETQRHTTEYDHPQFVSRAHTRPELKSDALRDTVQRTATEQHRPPFELVSDEDLLQSPNIISIDLSQQKKMVSVGVMCLPEQQEQTTQTHGPRSSQYYKTVPAKVDSRLPNHLTKHNRSDSSLQNTLGSEKSMHKTQTFSPDQTKTPVNVPRMTSPQPHHASKELKSLRSKLLQSRSECKDQQEDNILLVEQIAAIENLLQQKDKVIHKLQEQNVQLHAQTCKLQAEAEQQSKHLDSLKASHFESLTPREVKPLRSARDQVTQTTEPENPSPPKPEQEQGYQLSELEHKAQVYEYEYRKLESEIQDYKTQLQFSYHRYEQGHHSTTLDQTNKSQFYDKYKHKAKKLQSKLQKS